MDFKLSDQNVKKVTFFLKASLIDIDEFFIYIIPVSINAHRLVQQTIDQLCLGCGSGADQQQKQVLVTLEKLWPALKVAIIPNRGITQRKYRVLEKLCKKFC